MKPTRLILGSALAAMLALTGTQLGASVQDDDNLDACCLAAEWTLTKIPAAPASGTAAVPSTQRCQAALGNLSCCVGAEWLTFAASPIGSTEAAAPVTPAIPATPQSDESFCCIASEWSIR